MSLLLCENKRPYFPVQMFLNMYCLVQISDYFPPHSFLCMYYNVQIRDHIYKLKVASRPSLIWESLASHYVFLLTRYKIYHVYHSVVLTGHNSCSLHTSDELSPLSHFSIQMNLVHSPYRRKQHMCPKSRDDSTRFNNPGEVRLI